MKIFLIIFFITLTVVFLIIIFAIVFIFKYTDKKDAFKDKKRNEDGKSNYSIYYNNYDNDLYLHTPTVSSERITTHIPTNKAAGINGELCVNYFLTSLLRQNEYLLTNILLPIKNGHKTEIDCVLISRKGIFCIETKNWVGNIEGDDDSEYWIQKYDDLYMPNRRHKNPVKQNEAHCRTLDRILNYRFYISGAVIFAYIPDSFRIDSEFTFFKTSFKNYYDNLDDYVLSIDETKQIYQKLRRYVATDLELEKHEKDIKNSYFD